MWIRWVIPALGERVFFFFFSSLCFKISLLIGDWAIRSALRVIEGSTGRVCPEMFVELRILKDFIQERSNEYYNL